MNRLAYLALGFLATWASAYAQEGGRVIGTVIDDSGKPVAKANVHLAMKGAAPGHRIIQMYDTDSEGRFVIEAVPWGSYVVLVGKKRQDIPTLSLRSIATS